MIFFIDFFKHSKNKFLSFSDTTFISLIFFKEISLAEIQLFKRVGWLTINGAIPRPVEFPIPKLLQIFISRLTAFFGFLFFAT